MSETVISDIQLAKSNDEFSSDDNITINVKFSITGNLRDSFTEKNWTDAYEKNDNVKGKIISKCKGGVIVEHVETKSLMFCPGSQVSDKPLKDISHLLNQEQKFAIIKLDKLRYKIKIIKEIYRVKKIEDADAAVDNEDVPFRFLPCLIAGLA